MVFTSINFLYYFLPTVLILYFIVPKKYKNLLLLISSLLFYFYGEPKYIILMIIEIVLAYFEARLIEKYKSKEIFIFSIFIHVLLLCIFKYTNFLITNINGIFNTNISLLNIVLPIGISFYTFQIISYLVDVYKEKVKAQKNFISLATYVSLFPQLIAGPIVRYETINDELDNRKQTFNDFSSGISRFIIGLSKKVLIANILGELCNIFILSNEKTVLFYWIYGISYSLQIYFDFSAYSDMAIGLGRMFGFHFMENFDYPYISKSITEFWRRWHISLSSWFKDYVYIPLGGSREGTFKLIRNILIVWLLTGLWHGSEWTFVIWGMFIGILLVIEKLLLNKYIEKLPSIVRRIYTLFIIMISFIIFSGSNINESFNNIVGLFNFSNPFINKFTIHYLKDYGLVLIIAIFLSTPILKNTIIKFETEAIKKIINEYTNESGVRELERDINKIIRKVITEHIKSSRKIVSVRIKENDIPHYLEQELYKESKYKEIIHPGVVTAVACSSIGGVSIYIECTSFKGTGKYTFTGSLGSITKESIEIALSYIKSNAKRFDIDEDFFLNNDFHINFTEGAINKDGPSAGISIVTAILSHIKGVIISDKISLTGEITLNGDILKIGGLKEKTIACKRQNIEKLFIPKDNLNDIEWLEKDLKNDIEFIPVSNYLEIYEKIFS